MGGVSAEVKVGVFVLAVLAILAYMTIRLGKFTLGDPAGYGIWCVFDNATGLKPGAPVEMAGIPVGRVRGIDLYQQRARVWLLIWEEVTLPADSLAVIRVRGVLGDKYVALLPGSEDAPNVKPGERLLRAKVPVDLDVVMANFGDIAKDLRVLAASLQASIASPGSEENIRVTLSNLKEITGSLKVLVSDNQASLQRTVTNLESFSTDLSQISAKNKKALSQTIQNFNVVSLKLDRTIRVLTSVLEKVDAGQGTIGALVNERETVDSLNATLKSLKKIAKKVEAGEGSLGRLVNDEGTVDRLDEALTGINDYLTQANDWKVLVRYRANYLAEDIGLQNVLNIRLQPSADKFYLIGIVSDPRGQRDEEEEIVTWTGEDGLTRTTSHKTVKFHRDRIMFNAQIGKRFKDLTFRGGLFQSTGGVGVDWHLWHDSLTLSMEAFDFRLDENPHLRLAVDWHFWDYFIISAGWDHFISNSDYDDQGSSVFLGFGVQFFDDDLKFLLSNAPTP